MTFKTPLQAAFVLLPVIWVLLTIPIMIWQYRKYGALSFWRGLMVFSFTFYLVAAYFLVILPFPNDAALRYLNKINAPTMNWNIFAVFSDFFTKNPMFHGGGIIAGIKDPTFIQPVFNILLFVPLGIYLKYYFKFSTKKVILSGFLLSLFFELTQLSALYGIFPRPYRLFDVDDLLLNTTGAYLGALISPLLSFIIPNLSDLDEKIENKANRVSIVRRTLAWTIDFILILLISSLIDLKSGTVNFIAAFFIIEIIVPLITIKLGGLQTPGMRLVNFKVDSKDIWHFLERQLGLLLNYFVFIIAIFLLAQLEISSENNLFIILGFLVFTSFFIIYIIVDYLLLIKSNHKLWYETVSKTGLIGKKINGKRS